MRARSRFFSVAVLFLAGVGRVDVAAQSIEGVLLERGTDRPIDMAVVTLITLDGDSVHSALTDGSGRFRVESPKAGEFRLAASSLGHKTTIPSSVFTLNEGDWMSVEFRIEPTPIDIAGLNVSAQPGLMHQPKLVRSGFVERARQGFGRFLTPLDIERSHALTTSELLSRTGRVTTRYALGGDRIMMLGPRGYCTPIVYLDGFQISISDMSLDAIVPVTALEAVEVYRSGSEAPLQYGGTRGGCGVILLWTKAR